MINGYMAIDQFGETVHLGFVKHPRKALIEKLGVRSAAKMFVDQRNGGFAATSLRAAGTRCTRFCRGRSRHKETGLLSVAPAQGRGLKHGSGLKHAA